MRPCAAGLLAVLLLAVLLLADGCTHVVWYGHSPDRRQRVQVLERYGKQRVERGSVAGASHRGIGVEALVYSPDSRRLAYPAQNEDGRWVVLLDGQPGPAFDGIGEILFSPDSRHLAYLAQRGPDWQVLRDGEPAPVPGDVLRGSLQFSPDSRHLLLVAHVDGQARVVLDGRPGPPFDRVALLRPGPGGRLAYVGVGPAQQRVLHNGQPGPPVDEVGELVLSADGRRVAYSARRGQRWLVLLDGQQLAGLKGVVPSSLSFTADGKLLLVARQKNKMRVVYDGRPGPALDEIQKPVCGPGGRRGYIGRRGDQFLVVLDGVQRPARGVASSLTLGPGGRHAHLEHHGHRVELVHDQGRHSFDLVLPGTLVFSADGRHLACLAGDRGKRQLFLAIGGRRAIALDLEELNAELMLRPGTHQKWLRAWVQAELARALAGRR